MQLTQKDDFVGAHSSIKNCDSCWISENPVYVVHNYCAGVFDNKQKIIYMCVDPKISPVFLHEYHIKTHVFILTSLMERVHFKKQLMLTR